jgi:hypothetical protein
VPVRSRPTASSAAARRALRPGRRSSARRRPRAARRTRASERFR